VPDAQTSKHPQTPTHTSKHTHTHIRTTNHKQKMAMKEIVPDAQTYLGLIVGAKEGGVLTRVQRYHHLMTADVGLVFLVVDGPACVCGGGGDSIRDR
jgi:hypothetical protein